LLIKGKKDGQVVVIGEELDPQFLENVSEPVRYQHLEQVWRANCKGLMLG
jgi:hypothetical protein